MRWSRDPVINQLPFIFHCTAITEFLWSWLNKWIHSKNIYTNSVARHDPDFGSHNLTGCCESRDPVTSRPFCGCQSTVRTSDPCPRNIRSSTQRAKSHTRAVPSSDAVANLMSVGEKLKRNETINLTITMIRGIRRMRARQLNPFNDSM